MMLDSELLYTPFWIHMNDHNIRKMVKLQPSNLLCFRHAIFSFLAFKTLFIYFKSYGVTPLILVPRCILMFITAIA